MMQDKKGVLRVALVQMTSTDNLDNNLTQAEAHIDAAARQGASLIVLPECFSLMPSSHRQRLEHVEPPEEGRIQARLSEWAKRLSVYLVGGTINIASKDPNRPYSSTLVFNPSGEQVARYDKIHLFDALLNDGASYDESNFITRGQQVSLFELPWGKMGLNVCYDIRFPELARTLAIKGMQCLLVPSAFTPKTGEAHWEILLRARAIENQCFVLAPGQNGQHSPTRKSWGHSLIIDPWGRVLADAGEKNGIIVADLESKVLDQTQTQVPAMRHRRLNFNTTFEG